MKFDAPHTARGSTMTRFKQRLRKLESVFVVKSPPDQPRDDEFDVIINQDPEANALGQEFAGIIEGAVKGRPDRKALFADQTSLMAAMDDASLERLIPCIEALHARVDQLRKKPKPARPAEKTRAQYALRAGKYEQK
jgi:hypothetical protein